MRQITIAFCTAAFLFACSNESTKVDEPKIASATTTTETKVKADEWVPVDSATAMKTMMEAATPGPQHAMLAKSNGEWMAETSMWWTPEGKAETSLATCTNKMLFDGRYQQSTFKGDFGGMPFEGTSTTGYDNAKKVFFSTWIDNMGTGIMNMEGTWDDATKTINFKGKMVCPANGKECEMRETYKIVDDNTHLMEMYGPDMKTGHEFKSMQIKFVRKR